MKTYPVSEIFMSIQGEGPSVGHLAVFVRFAGCNLRCEFCDEHEKTEFDMVTAAFILGRIHDEIKEHCGSTRGRPVRVVLTGGEPLLHVDLDLLQMLYLSPHVICLETNGAPATARDMHLDGVALKMIDELVVSPKGPVSEIILNYADCLKVLVDEDGVKMGVDLDGLRRFQGERVLQPITPKESFEDQDEFKQFENNCKEAIWIAKQRRVIDENWRVIPQTHVWMNAR